MRVSRNGGKVPGQPSEPKSAKASLGLSKPYKDLAETLQNELNEVKEQLAQANETIRRQGGDLLKKDQELIDAMNTIGDLKGTISRLEKNLDDCKKAGQQLDDDNTKALREVKEPKDKYENGHVSV
jgi:chromosome segregation ATPase